MTDSGHVYRPDVDGLRAIAVGSVVLFHAFPWLVPGGYVGVDIFFVISGFLITTNIVGGLSTGTFTIRGFYDRRVRRIFPALVTVLLATYVLGWISLFDGEFKSLGKHVAGGAFFVSNLFLWAESGYFDTASEVKPLVHLWSLGIEEQFYIVWPLVLWALFKLGRRTIGPTIVLIVASFVLGLASIDGAGGYYSPLNRFWELLIGALLAMVAIRGFTIPENLRDIASTIGMIAIIVPMFALDGDSTFPGWNAIAPTLGAALLIGAGADNWWGRRILSLKGMIWIGLISYPLYLWHWPLLVYARIIASEVPPAGIRVGAIALAVLLSYLTYRLIERPLRFHRNRKAVVSGLVAAMAVVGGVGAFTWARDGVPSREFNSLNVALDPGEVRGINEISTIGCGLDATTQELFADCRTDVRGAPSYALIGDSKASTLIGGFMRTSQDDRWWTVIGGTKGIQSAVPLISDDPAHERFLPLIVPAIDTVNADPNIRVVVVQGAVRAMFEWPDFTNFAWLPDSPLYDKVEGALRETVRRLVDGGKKVVLYVDNPALAAPEDCTNRRTTVGFLNSLLIESNPRCQVTLDDFLAHTERYRALLQRVADEFGGPVTVFDPTPILCDENTRVCGHVRDGRRLYSYTDHPSDDAADLIGTELNAYLASL
ncbi:MAG: acyltransferase family protein [Ilumatobacteraceae bacterium]